jgi:polyisoprenoid-binding protein YceI
MRYARRSTRSLLLPFVLLASSVLTPTLRAQRPVAHSTLHEGTLSFLGRATVGDFVGVTTTVSGEIDGGSDYSGARGWVEAPVATLLTGNEHRDRDLRASMEAKRYPTIRFALTGATIVSSSVLGSVDSTAMVLHGAFSIHGITRVVALPATVIRSADTIRVRSSFPLDLADYRVGGLKKMLGLLRMERGIDVRVDLRFIEHPSQSISRNDKP